MRRIVAISDGSIVKEGLLDGISYERTVLFLCVVAVVELFCESVYPYVLVSVSCQFQPM